MDKWSACLGLSGCQAAELVRRKGLLRTRGVFFEVGARPGSKRHDGMDRAFRIGREVLFQAPHANSFYEISGSACDFAPL